RSRRTAPRPGRPGGGATAASPPSTRGRSPGPARSGPAAHRSRLPLAGPGRGLAPDLRLRGVAGRDYGAGAVAALGLALRDARRGLLSHLRRQLQRQGLADRHGQVAAVDDEVAQGLVELGRGVLVSGAFALESALDEPAGAVDAHEAHRVGALLARDPGDELPAPAPFRLLDLAALAGDLAGELLAHLVPDALAARRRADEQLKGGGAGGEDHL